MSQKKIKSQQLLPEYYDAVQNTQCYKEESSFHKSKHDESNSLIFQYKHPKDNLHIPMKTFQNDEIGWQYDEKEDCDHIHHCPASLNANPSQKNTALQYSMDDYYTWDHSTISKDNETLDEDCPITGQIAFQDDHSITENFLVENTRDKICNNTSGLYWSHEETSCIYSNETSEDTHRTVPIKNYSTDPFVYITGCTKEKCAKRNIYTIERISYFSEENEIRYVLLELSFEAKDDAIRPRLPFKWKGFNDFSKISHEIHLYRFSPGMLCFTGVLDNAGYSYQGTKLKILVFKLYENEPQFLWDSLVLKDLFLDYDSVFLSLNFEVRRRGSFYGKTTVRKNHPVFIFSAKLIPYRQNQESFMAMHINQVFFLNIMRYHRKTTRFSVSLDRVQEDLL